LLPSEKARNSFGRPMALPENKRKIKLKRHVHYFLRKKIKTNTIFKAVKMFKKSAINIENNTENNIFPLLLL
jgi:hypothetical protein